MTSESQFSAFDHIDSIDSLIYQYLHVDGRAPETLATEPGVGSRSRTAVPNAAGPPTASATSRLAVQSHQPLSDLFDSI